MRLRDLFRRWPRPGDAEAVRAMTAREWQTADQKPTYLVDYTDKPGSEDRAQRRAEWLAAQPMWDLRASVLELGCGAGRNLAAIQRRWPSIEGGGIDINEAALAEARRILPGGQFMHADLYAVAGAASRRADEAGVVRFSKTFWYTLEFGVVWQDGDLKAYGAGLLSSFGEMNAYRDAEIREWDPDAMAVMEYDIDAYQPVLFAAPDFDTVVDDLTAWFDAI